ncbi:hypothetical protein HDU76_009652 [Blyttiomyces sp. JEL0837]|nr:hypothetical protein HDU76_009652 [Blyttiomyces sp. JEL0837]
MRDIVDGYFPYELKDEYPDGVPFTLTDRHKDLYEPPPQAFAGSGFTLTNLEDSSQKTVSLTDATTSPKAITPNSNEQADETLLPSDADDTETTRTSTTTSTTSLSDDDDVLNNITPSLPLELQVPPYWSSMTGTILPVPAMYSGPTTLHPILNPPVNANWQTPETLLKKIPEIVIKKGNIVRLRDDLRAHISGSDTTTPRKFHLSQTGTRLDIVIPSEFPPSDTPTSQLTRLRIKCLESQTEWIVNYEPSTTLREVKMAMNPHVMEALGKSGIGEYGNVQVNPKGWRFACSVGTSCVKGPLDNAMGMSLLEVGLCPSACLYVVKVK